ncbi:MAG: hypothetical protein ACD_33C00005G0006 [uncultured bacterium]|nr:MAG: hypothetical protein ACD_33C00005G0006 [uncultured bacterium]
MKSILNTKELCVMLNERTYQHNSNLDTRPFIFDISGDPVRFPDMFKDISSYLHEDTLDLIKIRQTIKFLNNLYSGDKIYIPGIEGDIRKIDILITKLSDGQWEVIEEKMTWGYIPDDIKPIVI